jgi:hypothetical protein
MPAKWSKYDDQRLPNPKDSNGGGDDSQQDGRGTPPHLQMNWTSPHTPTAPPAMGGGGSGGGSGSGDGSSSGSAGGGGDATDPDKVDPDNSYYNPSLFGLLPQGTPDLPMPPPEYDTLEVNTDDLAAYEQNILTAAANLVSQYNALADRSTTVLSEEIWGRGEGSWYHVTQNQGPESDPTPHYVPTSSAFSARDFTKSIGPAQEGALRGASDLITLSGMYITVLDATVNSYAQMDMMAVFPDPQQLKAPNT